MAIDIFAANKALADLNEISYLDYDDFEEFNAAAIAAEKAAEEFSRRTEAEILDILEELNKDLNPGQKEAAETTEGAVIVIAGAGAGKTKTLTHRVATLLVKGVHAANILVVTFTNKAAEEIKERIEGMVGENAQYISAGTFHSVVFRKILKMHPESSYLRAIGVDMHECAIMDVDDATKLLKEALNELAPEDLVQINENDKWTPRSFEKIMSKARANGMDVNDFMASIAVGGSNEEQERITARAWLIYNRKCREAQSMDFDDILVFCNKMLQQEPHIAEQLGEEFKYVMLDEYQDTNRVQMNIMDAIVKKHHNICVVGDEKQSIYGFREADIQVILSFQNRYPEARQINMKNNYRSYSDIIRYANACADAMGQRLSDGQLIAMRQFEESPQDMSLRKSNKVFMVQFKDTEQEAKNIVRAIARDIQLGVAPKEIAILYRNRALKTDVERELVDMNMPYRLVGDTSFFQRAEVKDMVALIRFIFNPWDSLAGNRVLRATRMGVSEQAAKKAASNGMNTNEFLKEQGAKKLKTKKKGELEPEPTAAAKKLMPFIKLSEALRDSIKYGDSPAFIKDVLAEIWDIYLKPKLENSASRDADGDVMNSRLENVHYVLNRLEKNLNAGMEIDEIIEDLAMMVENNPDMDKDLDSKILMMTLHGSKGLEFDNVYMIGADNLTMPGEEPSYEEVEESRRLMYVGMTRAKKKLAISFTEERLVYGQFVRTQPSPFINEIEDRLKIRHYVMPKEKEQERTYSK